MTRHDYSEDQLVQEPAARFLAERLEWESVYAFDAEDFGPDSLLGRRDTSEVVLTRDLRAALVRLNPGLPVAALDEAIVLLTALDLTKTLVQQNEEKWQLLRDGVPLKLRDADGTTRDARVKAIDFDTPANNRFVAVRELWVKGRLWDKRCDIVGFVNGLPLVFVELKRYDKDLKLAFDSNYTDYKDTIPQLFHFNALVILSNGMDARFGTITSLWEHFSRWKRLDEDDPEPAPDAPLLPILLSGLCAKDKLLDVVENFTVFDRSGGAPLKIVARNHQLLGVNRVIDALQRGDADVQAGRLGVFWHTQGSGKSYSMLFLCQKIHRKISARYTFVVMTDRKELDEQIFGTFSNCGAATNKKAKARHGAGLERLLRDDHRYVFSLIHKFRSRVKQSWSERDDIIVISDEAHRTQYGHLALNMRKALARAKFIGFTGTPLIEGPEKQITREVFGGYVSIYDFQRAVADGATLPLVYENRGEKLNIVDATINQRIQERIEAARAAGDLDADQEEKLYRELARDYPVLTSGTRLEKVAADFVAHYHQRWRMMDGKNKALLVCLDKITCVRMFNLVQTEWQRTLLDLETRLATERVKFTQAGRVPDTYVQGLANQLEWMRATEMCVVVSPEQNEVKHFRDWKLDIEPHRKKMRTRDLEKEFKEPKHPFRVAIVCAMWLTGFDVKPLATLYLDKPMRGHTLMQAIARVNRVAPGKKNGLIIDYNGMLKSLRKALSTFAQGDRGAGGANADPLKDESEALAEYAASIAAAREHLHMLGFDLDELIDAEGFDKQSKLARGTLCVRRDADTQKIFLVLAQDIQERFRGLFPNSGLYEHDKEENAINAIYNKLQDRKSDPDISGILQELHGVVDTAVATQASTDKAAEPKKQYDLSKIDFERLRAEFSRSPYKQAAILSLQEKLEQRLEHMVARNPLRVNFYERYLDIIKDYNRDKDEVEIQRVFDELLRFHDSLDHEERRYARENLRSDAEQTIFDMLAKDTLTRAEREKIKQVAQELLAKLEDAKKRIDHWKEKGATQAQIKIEIIDHLLKQLPESYAQSEIESRIDQVFAHVFGERGTQGGSALH